MSTHTPGPWSPRPGVDLLEIMSVDGIDLIADCWPEDFTAKGGAPGPTSVQHPETAQANARLIAAAPELLDALDVLIIQAKGAVTGNYSAPVVFQAIDRARDAIAKATGQTYEPTERTPSPLKFVERVAALQTWDEMGEPSDGLADSHDCLMGLIEDARTTLNPTKGD